MYLRHKARSTILHTFTKEKNSRTKAGPGSPGSTPKSTLVVPLCAGGVAHFAVKSSRLYKSTKRQVVYCNFELAT